jgi:hypothetical protein
MMDNGQPPTDSTAPDDDLAYFVELIFRLFTSGISYPLGHILVDLLVERCLQQLRVICGVEGGADLGIEPQGLLLNGYHLSGEDAYASSLHALLQQAGVAGISFDRFLTHSHLLLATRRLLTRRTGIIDDPADAGERVKSTPCGMEVRFVVDAVVPGVDGPPEPLVSQITDIATRLPKARGQRLREEMTALLRRGAIHMTGFPFATGRDAIGLLLTAASARNLPEAALRCGYGERDTAILLSFVESLADLASRGDQRSPLALLCRSWCKSMEKKARLTCSVPAMVSKERGGRSCSTAALQHFLSVHLGWSPQGAPMCSGNRRPMLSLVLQQVDPPLAKPSPILGKPCLSTCSKILWSKVSGKCSKVLCRRGLRFLAMIISIRFFPR